MPASERARFYAAIGQAITETAQEAGPLGAPSGVVYAALMGQIDLSTYQSIIEALVKLGRIRLEGDCIHAVTK